MLPDVLFHPYHIIPPAKFVAALVKFSHEPVAEPLMKKHAVPCEVFILLARIRDTGVQVEDPLRAKRAFQRVIQRSADPYAPAVPANVDGCLRRH